MIDINKILLAINSLSQIKTVEQVKDMADVLELTIPKATAKLDLEKQTEWIKEQIAALYAKTEMRKVEEEAEAKITLLNKQVDDLKSTDQTDKLKAEIERLKAEKETDKEIINKLEIAAKDIIRKATEINEAYDSLETDEERAAFTAQLDEQAGGLISKHFRSVGNTMQLTSDLPISKIINTLPIRIVEQQLFNTVQNYTLAELITFENVRNGVKQLIYGDFTDADNMKAYDDVTLADFNGFTTPAGQENYQVNDDKHVSYKLLDSMLNDVTLSMGLFLAIVSSALNGFTKPIAKTIYKRFMNFLNKTVSYDEIKEFTNDEDTDLGTRERAKELYKHIISISTTSRSNLKKVVHGLTSPFEWKADTTKMTLILNSDYSANYEYNLKANTFQLGSVTYPVKKIIVVDFNKIAGEYVDDPASTVLKDNELILFEEGVYIDFVHYDGTKIVDTPKMYKIFHHYQRRGDYRRKDKYLLGFKRPTSSN